MLRPSLLPGPRRQRWPTTGAASSATCGCSSSPTASRAIDGERRALAAGLDGRRERAALERQRRAPATSSISRAWSTALVRRALGPRRGRSSPAERAVICRRARLRERGRGPAPSGRGRAEVAREIGMLGQLRRRIADRAGLPAHEPVFVAEIDLDAVLDWTTLGDRRARDAAAAVSVGGARLVDRCVMLGLPAARQFVARFARRRRPRSNASSGIRSLSGARACPRVSAVCRCA